MYPEFNTRYPLLLTNLMKRPLSRYPNDIGVVYRNETGQYLRFTWRQWYERTCQLAHALKELGIKPGKPGKPGDRVATMALNHHRHLELCYAPVGIGAIAHPINMRLSLDHMTHTINHAEDKVIFVDDTFISLLESIYDRIKPVVKAFVYMSDRGEKPRTKIRPLYEYEELIQGQPKEFNWPYMSEDTYAVLYYTTGTTGLPKGVMFTHRQLYIQILHVLTSNYMAPRLPSDPKYIGQDPRIAVPLINVPLFHIHAWGAPWYYVFCASKIVLPGRFTPQSFCELVQSERVTTTSLVPTMLAMLLEYEALKDYDLSSLVNIGVGGGALPLGLKAKAERLFPYFTVSSGYGMTETAATVITAAISRDMVDWPKEKLDQVRVKTGVPVAGIEVQVVDENGNPVPHDNETLGEILLRGPWIMGQYYKDPKRTAAAWRDGWFHTGDMAKIDQDGYIIIADRITDVIRSGAEMIPTVLLENLTATSDYVLEATYVGVPDEKWGERPMALVKPLPGSQISEEDIYRFLEEEGVAKGKIAKWMLPDYIAFCDDIPKTSVGKYDKIAIRKRLDEFLARAKNMRRG